jgi:acyl-CoA synthetase (AMP-forming)/AMP-acid ligase II
MPQRRRTVVRAVTKPGRPVSKRSSVALFAWIALHPGGSFLRASREAAARASRRIQARPRRGPPALPSDYCLSVIDATCLTSPADDIRAPGRLPGPRLGRSLPATVPPIETLPAWATPRHPPSTVVALLDAAARRRPQAPAILAPGREPLTHAALAELRRGTAAALCRAGLTRGSRVALALDEGPEFATALVSSLCCVTCAPVNADLEETALADLFRATRATAVVVPEASTGAAARAARRAGLSLIELRTDPAGPAGAFSLRAEWGRQPAAAQSPDLDDIAVLAHTTGTTGSPKIVPFEHWRLAEGVLNRVELCAIGPADRALLLTPLYSNASIRRGLLPSLVSGGSVVCPGPLRPMQALGLIESLQATHFIAVPATLAAMLEELGKRAAPLRHALRFVLSGTAALPASVREGLEAALRVPVLSAYGMTETGSIAQMPYPPEPMPPGCVGRPTFLQVAIADESGQLLEVGEPGEVVVRGAECFGGYEDNDAANRAAFRDGWFRTGDAGWLDEGGHLFLRGRIKEVVNRGGAKVAPTEVEEALARHPRIAEAAAFALPHPTLGEDLAAAVVWRGPEPFDERAVRAFAGEQLAAFKVPSRIVALDTLPRGALGKLNRALVAQKAAAALRVAYEAPAGDVELEIARAFGEILGVERVGRHDNFFQAGGDSLRAMRVVARLAASGLGPLAPQAVFRAPTVALLAQEISSAPRRPDPAESPPPLVPLARRAAPSGS